MTYEFAAALLGWPQLMLAVGAWVLFIAGPGTFLLFRQTCSPVMTTAQFGSISGGSKTLGGTAKEFGLADAVQHFHSVNAATHRIWNYLAILGGGLVLALVSNDPLSNWQRLWVMVGFLLFAGANGRLLYLYQSELCVTSDCIKAHGVTSDSLRPLIAAINPFSAKCVAVRHALFDGVIVLLIWILPF